MKWKDVGRRVGLALVAVAAPALASAATFVGSSYRIEANAFARDEVNNPTIIVEDGGVIEATDEVSFDEALAFDVRTGTTGGRGGGSARLTSSFSPSNLMIDGAASGANFEPSPGFGSGSGNVAYELVFEVDTVTPYRFDIQLSTFEVLGRIALAEFALVNGSGADVFRFLRTGETVLDRIESGRLDPGRYTLRLDLEASPANDFSASASAMITGVIPEPGTAALLGVGLAGLALRSRRS